MSNQSIAESSSTTQRRKVDEPNGHREKEDLSIAFSIRGVSPDEVINAFQAPRHTLDDLSPYIRDRVLSNSPRLLESFLHQRWTVKSADYFPRNVICAIGDRTNEPDCAVVFGNRLGDGWMLLVHYDVLAVHCESMPSLPSRFPPGQLPVVFMKMDVEVISLWILLAILTYCYNHNPTQLFSTILCHVHPVCIPVPLFHRGQDRTAISPSTISDRVVEDYARTFRERTTPMQRQIAWNSAQAFVYTALSLRISDFELTDTIAIAVRVSTAAVTMDQADSNGFTD
ncbi:hypothetical protein IW261DRAFT_1560263 [Armillaria novae-zelandiae]|uniref:Uncharacterized protein n=1 Tax=Armillaria novae-zelandiae TaxID=153914 RepID=A0AA39PJ21_9AGAR|nr:hypothetical protein IW261DRAFT_1560263 [Armillaria novae-zelandiae]